MQAREFEDGKARTRRHSLIEVEIKIDLFSFLKETRKDGSFIYLSLRKSRSALICVLVK